MTTYTNEKAAGASKATGLSTGTNRAHFLKDGAIQQAHDGTANATQLAHLTVAGRHVHKGSNGDFLVSKYSSPRHCNNFTELHALVRQVGIK